MQAKLADVTLTQAKRSQYPNLDFTGQLGFSSGRNQDPTSFSLITQSYLSSGYTLQAGINLFNWFSKQNTIAANSLDAQASRANVEK